MSAEPCVCERLWESIVVLRESGQRYGMNERDIERFISQVLQTNEPQDQPGLLRTSAKGLVVLTVSPAPDCPHITLNPTPGDLVRGRRWFRFQIKPSSAMAPPPKPQTVLGLDGTPVNHQTSTFRACSVSGS